VAPIATVVIALAGLRLLTNDGEMMISMVAEARIGMEDLMGLVYTDEVVEVLGMELIRVCTAVDLRREGMD
jgi:hypothetical protein